MRTVSYAHRSALHSSLPATEPNLSPLRSVPTERDRHLLSRFSFGVTPGLVADSQDAGGARAWFEDQLTGHARSDDFADSLADWWPHLWWSPAKLDDADRSGELPAGTVSSDFARWTLLRRIYSTHQVLEVMADMWSNLFHVPTPLAKAYRHRMLYDATIRENALGRFDDLVVAADTHPSMLCYLDNAKSSKQAPNENLGRELLELHTVGRDSEFTEDDVHNSAMIMTGWQVDLHDTWEPQYVREDHYVGRVSVMGFSDPNDSSDGREVTKSYLRWLARQPSTARRVCERLAIRFVYDTPSRTLLDDLQEVYLDSGTDIRATLRALVDHDEFAAHVGEKVRTPSEDLVNTYRVMGVDIDRPRGEVGEAASAVLSQSQAMGQAPFDWGPPNGFPDVAPAWSSASRMLGSWRVHRNTCVGNYPRVGITYTPYDDWLPDLPAPFDDVVDNVSRLLLARPASDALVDAAATATGTGRRETITKDSALVNHQMANLLNAVLDTPEHMSR